MAFSDNAIGFYLQLDDQLTPALRKAETAYTRFTKSIDTLNKQAVDKMSGGFQSMAALVNSFAQLPEAAVTGYKKARAALTKQIKAITQKVDLEFSTKGQKKFVNMVAEGVAKAVGKAKLRLSVDIPLKRNKYFDTTLPLRESYKDLLQPPDYTGFFRNLPRFATGGVVPGPTPGTPDGPGRDKTLIWAEPGEVVFSKKAMGQLSQMPKSFREAAKGALAMSNELDMLKREVELGLDPQAPLRFAAAEMRADEATAQLNREFMQLSDVQRRRMLPHMEDLGELTRGFTDAAEDATKETNDLGRSLGSNVGFLTARTIIGDLQGGFNDLMAAADQVGGHAKASTGEIDNMADSLFELGKITGGSRKEMVSYGKELLDLQKTYGDSIAAGDTFAASLSLGQAGAGRAFIKEHAADVAAFGKLGLDVAQSYYQLGDAVHLSAAQVRTVMLNARNAAATTALTFEDTTALIEELTGEGSNFAAGISRLTAQERQAAIQGMVQMRAAMSEDWAAPLGEKLQEAISGAMVGDQESMAQLARITGMSADAVTKALASGDTAAILTQVQSTLSGITDAASAAPLAEALGLDSADALVRWNKEAKDIISTNARLSKGLSSTTESQQALAEATAEQVPWFEKMTNRMQTWVARNLGLEVIDMLDGINFQMVASIGYLASMSGGLIKSGLAFAGKFAGGIGKALGKLVGFNKAAKATQAVSAASSAGGGGMGIGGFFKGLAKGLMAFANPKVILGTAVVVGALVGIAYAAKVASPAFKVIFKGMEGLVEIFAQMDPSQILATTAALALMGPSFAMIGTGVFTMAVGFAAAAPFFLGFLKIMETFGGGSQSLGEGFAGVINGLVEGFSTIDRGGLRAALEAIGMAVAFLGGFAAIIAGVAIAATAALVWKGITFLQDLFGGPNSMMRLMGDFAGDMGATINVLGREFGRRVKVDRLQKTMPVFVGAMEFMGHFAATAWKFTKVTIGAALYKVVDNMAKFFTGKGLAGALVDQGRDMAYVISNLGTTFARLDNKKVYDGLDSSLKVFEHGGTFLKGFTNLREIYSDADPGAIDRILTVAGNFWSGSTPVQRITENGRDIVAVMRSLVAHFAPLGTAEFKSNLEAVHGTFAGTGKFLRDFGKLQSIYDDITPSALAAIGEKIAGIFGVNSPVQRILDSSEGIVKITKNIKAKFSDLSMKELPEVLEKFNLVGQLLGGFGAVMRGVNALAPLAKKVGDTRWMLNIFGDEGAIKKVSKVIVPIRDFANSMSDSLRLVWSNPAKQATAGMEAANKMFDQFSAFTWNVGQLSYDLGRFDRVKAVEKHLPAAASRVGRIISTISSRIRKNTTADVEAATKQLSEGVELINNFGMAAVRSDQLRQVLNTPTITVGDIEDVTNLSLEARDALMAKLMEKNNELLEQMVGLMSVATGRPPPTPDAGASRTRVAPMPLPITMRLSAGGD